MRADNLMGMHMMVVDFRGYGWSSDEPTRAATLLSDAEPLAYGGALEAALGAAKVDHRGLPVVLFGRSMGSSVAIHLAACHPTRFAGLVVESGIASMRARLDGAADSASGKPLLPPPPGGVPSVGLLENEEKLRELTSMPTLVLHGAADRIVPPEQATTAYAAAGAPAADAPSAEHTADAARKTLVMIPGAGHNDIAMSEQYFQAIARFLDEAVG